MPDNEPHWFRELNLDPRYRAGAGLGTHVVQRDQEDLMEEAWAQVGDVLSANKELRWSQLARAVSARMKAKHLDPLPADLLVHVTRPLHRRVALSPRTLFAEAEQSLVGGAVLSGALRRLARPRGTLARRHEREHRRSIPLRINRAEIAPAQPRRSPDGTTLLDSVSGIDTPPPTQPPSPWRLRVALLLAAFAIVAAAIGMWALALTLSAIGVGVAVAARVARKRQSAAVEAKRREAANDHLRSERLTPNAVLSVPPRPGFKLVASPDAVATSIAMQDEVSSLEDSEEGQSFRRAAAAILTRALDVTQPQPGLSARQALDFAHIQERLGVRLDPERTIVARVHARLRIPQSLWHPKDPLDPVIAYPEFPRPMYEALAELSADHVIPGLEHIPTDTVTLLETNPPVIQAFMAGLNHEMARELLWREYPTDQRGSYFRQFWDPSGRVPAPQTEAEHEALKDIPELHRWRSQDHIGESLSGDAAAHQLVLLVRGELLRQFPTAMVFAERAMLNKTLGRLEPEGSIRWPLFHGRLAPDVHFLGFDLTEEQARGDDEADDPGWYFVIQQQPTEPLFGLDVASAFADTLEPVKSWDHLSWGHLATEEDFEDLTFVHVGGELPKTSPVNPPNEGSWGTNAAHMALIMLQKPTRIAIHARVLLPQPDEDNNA